MVFSFFKNDKSCTMMLRFAFIYRLEYVFDLLSVDMFGDLFNVLFHAYVCFRDGYY